jgi:glycosyltransferase involved in cell wall biosynthesis
MKITIIAHEMPYPPIHGAPVDIWRRIKAFSELGAQIQLVSWVKEQPKQEQLVEIHKYVQQSCFILYKRSPAALLNRMVDLSSYPREVASRILKGKDLKLLLSKVSFFNPDIIFLDGIHGGEIAKTLSRQLSRPLVTRKHNIEHLYQQRLYQVSKGVKKLKKSLSLTNVESYEKSILNLSSRFYDISPEDLHFWQNQGFTHGKHLPPLMDVSCLRNTHPQTEVTPNRCIYDVVFLGNLNSANNVAGIQWFLTKVMPVLQAKKPDIKVLIAGSNPLHSIQELCETTPGVDLKINPPSAAAIYQSGRVLINPSPTGSGVSIKSLEMLTYQKPIVSTPQGLSGLPEQVYPYFQIATEVDTFATAIIKCFSTDDIPTIDLQLLDSLFGYGVIKDLLFDFQTLVKTNQPQPQSQSKPVPVLQSFIIL